MESGKTLTLTIEIPARAHIGAPLDLERGLQQALNGRGQTAMTEALSRYDTEGEPIRFGSDVMTSKGRSPEGCKTLFGEVALERHTYQSSDGGKTFCPLEHHARICENASIGLCQILAAKHVSLNQVHHDKVPMPIPDGAAPPFTWTLQPGRATFDPPVQIEYPNMSGLPAGAIANFLSFNHDTEKFEIVASGHVTADGSTIVTDPGAGLSVAGWGCNCPPYSGVASNGCNVR